MYRLFAERHNQGAGPKSEDESRERRVQMQAKRNFLGRFLAGFLSHDEPKAAKAPGLETVEHNLSELMREAKARAVSRAEVVAAAGEGKANHSVQEQWARERDGARERMKQAITALHGRLETGLSAQTLERGARQLREHLVSPGHQGAVEDRIDDHVMHYLYDRCGELAWNELEARMGSRGLTWPVPEEDLLAREQDETQSFAERRRRESKAAFLSDTPQSCACLVEGDVPAWEFLYPAQGSALWDETVLCGAASGIRAALFAAGLELWLWRPQTLDDAIRDALRQVAATVEAALQDGVVTEDEMQRVEREEQLAYGQSLPLLIWSYVRDQLPTLGAPGLVDLVAGTSRVDPICGASLHGEQVAARLTAGDRTVFFCRRECRDRYEASCPVG